MKDIDYMINIYQQKNKIIIPNHVFDIISNDIKNNDINIDDVTFDHIKNILKKHNIYQIYEDDILAIYYKIHQIKPPNVPFNINMQIHILFDTIFKYNRSMLRKLKYELVLYKLFELVEFKDGIQYLLLSTNQDEMMIFDDDWEISCSKLSWKFNRFIF